MENLIIVKQHEASCPSCWFLVDILHTDADSRQKEAADPPVSLPTKISAQALQVLSQEVRWKELESKATAHHAPDLGRSNPLRSSQTSWPSVDSVGPWDKDDLSYGPSFGPEELQSADVAKVLELPIQPGAYYVGGILAKTDNCQVHLGATYSNKTKIIVKRVSRITSGQPFQTHVNEVRCLLRLHHQHIVKLLGVFDGPANFLDIILEYCPLGALRNYVNEVEEPLGRNTTFPFYVSSLLVFSHFSQISRFLSNGVVPLVLNSTKSKSFRSRRLLQVLCDVAEALAYIHREWFAHLDVKPHNILVVLEGEARDFWWQGMPE